MADFGGYLMRLYSAGPLTEYLFYFPGLRQLDLSNNQLVGTIPAYALM